MREIWTVVCAQRDALFRDLEALSISKWRTPSLCPGWDVQDVLAHLVDDAKTTRLGFISDLVAARFDFDRCNALGVIRERAEDPQRTLTEFRAVSGRTSSAPAPRSTRLVEIFVHAEDIRRPLGIEHHYPAGFVAAALHYQVNTKVSLGGGKERVHGLRLIATDANTQFGTGKEVRGTAIALLLAASGRPVGPHELTGPGSPALLP